MNNKTLEPDKVIPATFDKVFKAVWQDSRNKSLLSYVISYITNLNKRSLYNDMVFKNTELPKEHYKEKGMITDLLIGSIKNLFNLEMNKTTDKGKIIKNNGYAHKLVFEATKMVEEYDIIRQLNFNASLNFDKELYSDYMMRSRDDKSCADDNYIIYHINMVKTVYKYYNNSKFNKFEKVIIMMCTDEVKVLEELAKGDEELMMFKETIKEKSRDNNIIGLYNEEEARKFENEINLKDSHDEGYRLGHEDGFEHGDRIGFERGTETATTKIAKNMLELKMHIDDIAKATGLSKQKIKSLQ